MKQKLQEQQKRILEMMEQEYPPSIQKELDNDPEEKFRYDLIDFIEKLQAQNKSLEEIKTQILSAATQMVNSYDPEEDGEETPNDREINVGDEVTPKKYPQLKSTVDKIDKFMGDIVYVLQNGGTYTRDELN